MNKNKVIKSYFGSTIESHVIEQNSNVLVVLLPGLGYTLDNPLMYYSKKLALEAGFDVLPIEYGFQVCRREFERKNEEELRIVIDESYEILKKSLNNKYNRIIFIGKSIGTFIQRSLENRLQDEKCTYLVSNIYLTPTDEAVELGLKDNSLVVFGTEDPLISNENKKRIKQMNDINYIEIRNVGHSLERKDDIIKSIEILKEIMLKEKEFLIQYTNKNINI